MTLPRPGIVFIGMETSGALRRRFQAAGYETYSGDFLPSEDGGEAMSHTDEGVSLGRHLIGDVFDTLANMQACDLWPDLAIFHPDCTYHTLAGAWAFGDGPYHQRTKPETLTGAARREAREAAESDIRRIAALPIRRKAIENPRGTLGKRVLGRETQFIHPHQFGDDASKGTCLWLWNLPPLVIDPRMAVAPRYVGGKPRWANQTDSGQNRLSPDADRWKDRSRTYPGIADAIVSNWAPLIGE